MAEYIESEFNPCDECEYTHCNNCVLHEFAMKFAKQLNANVAPVMYGRWDTIFVQRNKNELASYTHVCSMCKFLYRDLRVNGYNYCPNCGANMKDGEG